MTIWPNWIDLIIVILFFRTCYKGFAHGLIAELLSCAGALTMISLTLNYWGRLAGWLGPWVGVAPGLLRTAVFWGLFLTGAVVVRLIIRRVAGAVTWEHLHWTVQGSGLVLGGLRGLWWSGFLLVVLVSSGVAFLQQSVEERSRLGPRLLRLSRAGLVRVADRFPGAAGRGPQLVPPIRPVAR